MKYELRIMKKFTLGFLILTSLFLIPGTAHAITMTNEDYILKTELNTGGGVGTNDKYKLDVSIGGGPTQGLSEGTYSARIGFQYLRGHRTGGFRFSISEGFIDFGILSPVNPITRSNIATVTLGAANGYGVQVSQSRPLTAQNDIDAIPDTTCDNGACTEVVAGPWTNLLTYGFGYRCDNQTEADCSKDFANSTYFKHFANTLKGEKAPLVMSGTKTGKIKSAKITYKVNIPKTQAAGIYSNIITFVAIPTF